MQGPQRQITRWGPGEHGDDSRLQPVRQVMAQRTGAGKGHIIEVRREIQHVEAVEIRHGLSVSPHHVALRRLQRLLALVGSGLGLGIKHTVGVSRVIRSRLRLHARLEHAVAALLAIVGRAFISTHPTDFGLRAEHRVIRLAITSHKRRSQT